ncbi:MAG TPA: hypothetical protein VIO14_05890 [Dehalococcoidia bacterium]
MSERPVLVLFLGGMGGSEVEELVGGARRAAALDTLERALATEAFDGAVLATDDPSLADEVPPGVVVDVDRAPFHFGARLAEIIGRYGIARPCYLGGGSVPLLPTGAFADLAAQLAGQEAVVISNNFYSADLVAFVPGDAVERITPPDADNILPRRLRDQAGLPSQPMPRTAATQFDIDTPTDLAVLSVAEGLGPRLAAYVAALGLDTARLRAAMRLFTDREAEVLVAGRVGSQVWQYLERETACRVRLVSEERGMEAAGRDVAGLARSLLGFYVQAAGVERFFQSLPELGGAAFIDTRVLCAHMGETPAREDRFWSDLGRPERVQNAFLRRFTEGALGAAVPVVLGGHSLVAGGLMALVEAAWLEHDRLQAGT